MKILAVQPVLKGYTVYPVAGGKDKAALEISRALVAAGHALDVLPLPWGLEPRNTELVAEAQTFLLSPDGLQARMLPTLLFPSAPELARLVWRFLRSRRAWHAPHATARDLFWRGLALKRRSVEHALAASQPDLLLVHQTGSDVPLLARAAGFRGRMVLIHHSAGVSAFVSRYDHVVFVSTHQREMALRRYPELCRRSSVIHYFAGVEYFMPIDPTPRREVTFIGIMDSNRKGLDLLLQAFANDARLRDVTLNIVGDGPLRAKWETQAREGGVAARFHGRISHAANAEILARSGAYVMPSRGEGLALVYLEALCMGVPIVGFSPNVRELETVLGRPVGFAFKADSDPISQLAQHIVTLVADDSPLPRAARLEIASEVRSRFSLEAFHRHYTEFIRTFVPDTP